MSVGEPLEPCEPFYRVVKSTWSIGNVFPVAGFNGIAMVVIHVKPFSSVKRPLNSRLPLLDL